MPREKTDVEERWQRGDRGMRDEKEVWGCVRRRRKMRRGRGGQWEREIAGLPGLQSLSVILCVSQPIPGLRRRYSSCANESIYTHKCTKHTFSHSINAHWKLEISLFFILCHSLIRFHHHSNPFSSTFFSLFLPHSHSLPHCSTADLLAVSLATAASCLSVCVAMEEG